MSGVLHDWIDISELLELEELVLTMLLDFLFTDFVGSFEQVGVQLSVVVSIWVDVDGWIVPRNSRLHFQNRRYNLDLGEKAYSLS